MCIVYMYGSAEVTLRDRVAAEPLERTAVETTNSSSATAPTAKQTSTSFHRPTPEKHRQNTTFNQSTYGVETQDKADNAEGLQGIAL